MITGVADERGTRIGDQSDTLALFDPADQHIGFLLLVVIVQREGRHRDLVVAEQNAGVAGIFGGDQVDAAQNIQRSLGDVSQIADRSGHYIQGWDVTHGISECPDNCVAILPRLHYGEFQHWSGNELEPGYKAAKCITTLRHPTRGNPAGRLCVGAQSTFGAVWHAVSLLGFDQECPVVSGAGRSRQTG